jgi:hypothetical protein
MLKKTLILLSLLLLLSKLSAQNNAALKYEAVSFSINNIISRLEPDYFNFKKPILINPDTTLSDNFNLNDTTTMEIYDIETYELRRIKIKDIRTSLPTPEETEKSRKEWELWDFKEKLGKKVVLVTSYPIKDQKERLKGYQPFKHRAATKTQQKLATALSKVDAVFWDTKRLSSENYLFIENTKENQAQYKYAIVAYIHLSDMVFNKEKTECAIFVSVHYKISETRSDSGATGFGGVMYRGIKCQMQFWNILGKPHLAFSNLNVYEVYY